jgi:L-aminopeptidase/D-esterase-like protein
VSAELPAGFRLGHSTDAEGVTGCSVILCPDGGVTACEVRGGGPGTRETDLLSPSAAVEGVNAILLSGGSAYGLAAADGVVRFLEERGVGFETRAGIVPLVSGAVVFDLALGSAAARPDAASGYEACEIAGPEVARGNVGAGTGCTVGKLLGPAGWTRGGFGFATRRIGPGATVAAVAVVNAFGEVLAEDGRILAGVRRDGGYVRTVDLLAAGETPHRPWREATTLVCVMTDARLTKTDAWLVARAAGAGVARAVDPAGTSVDGDVCFCAASPVIEVPSLAVAAVAAEVAAAAIRDGVRSATGLPGCPAAGG